MRARTPLSVKYILPTPDTCPHRVDIRRGEKGEDGVCQLLSAVSGAEDPELARVGRDACAACCDQFPPEHRLWNPSFASLVYDVASRILAEGGVAGCDAARAALLRTDAENALFVEHSLELHTVPARAFADCCYLGPPVSGAPLTLRAGSVVEPRWRCEHPRHETTTAAACATCRDWSSHPTISRLLTPRELTPPPATRSGAAVRHWSVGVLTAPRREPTLEWCLDNLARAGWADPHVFVDGVVPLPPTCARLRVTWREARVGAWPHYFLSLAEMVMRAPRADAYFLLQDDALVYDQGDLRAYLEATLWPGESPSIVSLFCSQAYNVGSPGWHPVVRPWIWGAQAFLFPRDIAQALLSDPFIVRHRWEGSNGLAQVDVLLGDWQAARGLPVWVPNPSLVQHVGNTSVIWPTSSIQGERRADWFAGDIDTVFARGDTPAAFPETRFPCAPEGADDYVRRVADGRQRMRRSRLVLCGLCRDVRHFLPRFAARVEHLGGMFAEFRVILMENDSTDATPEFLQDWRRRNPHVHVLSEQLQAPRFPQIRCEQRAAQLARFRNRYLEYALRHFPDFEFLIVADTDLAGGWSYDGIAHTFGHEDWDFVGSYGLLSRNHDEGADFVHFDAWAFRGLGHWHAHPNDEVNSLVLRRGEALLPVHSCFGGFAVYRLDALRDVRYAGPDCEHVELHRAMWQRGHGRGFLNPNQIALYSP